MKNAIVDIGSNTIKIDIYDGISSIFNKTLPIGLIKYIENGIMTDDGITELIATLDTFRLITEAFNCDRKYYIATASLRNIKNQADVIDIVYQRMGIAIEIISGHDEAQYSYEGLRYNIGSDIHTGIMIDMGGGSTEILGFRDGKVCDVISLPFGCLKLYLNFNSDIRRADDYIDSLVSDINWLKNYGDTVYLIGGTARSLNLFGEIINNIDDLINLLGKIKDDTELIKSVVPDRLTTIVPGLAAYCRLLYHMGIRSVVVTQASVRDGYIINKIKRR